MVGYCTVPGHVSVQNQIDYHCSYSAVSAWLRAVQFLDMCLHVYRTRSIIIVVTQPCLHGCVLCRFLDMCLYDDEVPRSETLSCVDAVAANRYGRDVALNFLMENFPMLLSRSQPQLLPLCSC